MTNCASCRRHHPDTFIHANNNDYIPSAAHNSTSRNFAAQRRVVMLESYLHLSLKEYLVGLMGNAGCKELVLIRDDPRSSKEAQNEIVNTVTTGRFGGKERKDQATLTSWPITKPQSVISNSYKNNEAIMIILDYDNNEGVVDGGAICNEHGDDTCWCECTMCKTERTKCEVSCDASVHDRAHSLLSRKSLAVPSPPPSAWASNSCSSVATSPSSVLFHPNNADRRPLRRIGRATTIPSTRFDLRRDLGHDYHNCSRSDLKTDGPPCPPQRRPSIRNLDSHG